MIIPPGWIDRGLAGSKARLADRRRGRVSPAAELLEPRRLLATVGGSISSLSPATGELLVCSDPSRLTVETTLAYRAEPNTSPVIEVRQGEGPEQYDPALVRSIRVEGSAVDDRFLFDLRDWTLPAGGISFDGHEGYDRLVLSDGSTGVESNRAAGLNAGVISLDGSDIPFAGLEELDDRTGSSTLMIVLPLGAAGVDLNDGQQGLPGPRPFRISQIGGSAGLNTVLATYQTSITVQAPGDKSRLIIRSQIGAALLQELTVDGGGGDDRIDLELATGATSYRMLGGAGDDLVTVTANFVQPLNTIFADGGTGNDTLLINAGGRAVTIVGDAVLIGNLPPVKFASFESFSFINAAFLPVFAFAGKMDVAAVERVPLDDVVVATFRTLDTAAFVSDFGSRTIAWGDGTITDGILSLVGEGLNGSVFELRGSHTYAFRGDYAITVDIDYNGGGRSRFNTVARVAANPSQPDAPAIVLIAAPIVAPPGSATPRTRLGSFNSSDTDTTAGGYSAEVAWGDGTASTAEVVARGEGGFDVFGSHNYATPGAYLGTLVVRSARGASASDTFSVFVDRLDVGVAVVTDAVAGVPIDIPSLATISSTGGPVLGSNYQATVDYGDGSPPEVVAFPTGSNTLSGAHTYQSAGVYAITVRIATATNPSLGVFGGNAIVSGVPIRSNVGLDPASDSGISPSDRITNVNRPRFLGVAQPGTIFSLFATDEAGQLIAIGSATADAAGRYALVSTVALPDGTYRITSRAGDVNRVDTPADFVDAIVIDTIAPRLNARRIDRASGRFIVVLQDERSGLVEATLRDPGNFVLNRRGRRPGSLPLTSLDVLGGGGTNDPRTVIGKFARGRSVPRGPSAIQIGGSSQGINDVAGNALNGEVSGSFPPGFRVRRRTNPPIVEVIRQLDRGPRLTQGFGTPNSPAGEPGVRTTIGRPTPRPAATINSTPRRKRVAVAVDTPAPARRDLARPAASGRRSPAKA